MKFSPNCRTTKLGMIYAFLERFYSLLIGNGSIFNPKSGLGKSLDPQVSGQWQGTQPMCGNGGSLGCQKQLRWGDS